MNTQYWLRFANEASRKVKRIIADEQIAEHHRAALKQLVADLNQFCFRLDERNRAGLANGQARDL